MDEMKLACVIDACGGIDGRVKLQKIVYLLKAMGYELPFDDFRIRQLGPFSRAVAVSMDLLTTAGFVEETQQDIGTDPETEEPIRQYSYAVSDSIKSLLATHFRVPQPQGKPNLETAAMMLREHDRAVLEVAATKLYLQQEEGMKGSRLEDELRRLKGHLASRFADAKSLIADLKNRGWL
jgi:uncharacterized protein YwgA